MKNILRLFLGIIGGGISLGLPVIVQAFQEVEITEVNYTGYTQWSEEETDFRDEYIRLDFQGQKTIDEYHMRIVSGDTDTQIDLSGTYQDFVYIRRIGKNQNVETLDQVFPTSQFGGLSNDTGAFIELRNADGDTVDSFNMHGSWSVETNNQQSLHKQDNQWQAQEHSWVDQQSSPSPDESSEEESSQNLESEADADQEENDELQKEQSHESENEQLSQDTSEKSQNSQEQDQSSEETKEEQYQRTRISEVYQAESDEEIRVQGEVLIEPEVIYANSFYIHDGERVLRVSFGRSNPPDLVLGDTVEIHGSLLKSDTQEYLRLQEYQDIDKNVPEIATDYSEIPGRPDGGYVGTLEGEVTSLTNYRLDLQYQNTEVYVRLHDNLDVEAKVGDMVAITGFWERRNDIMRLNPWKKDHIIVQAKESEPQEDGDQERVDEHINDEKAKKKIKEDSKDSEDTQAQDQASEDTSDQEKSSRKTEEKQYPKKGVSEVYQADPDEEMRVQGEVLIEPEVIYANSFYIHDGERVLRVSFGRSNPPDLVLGDTVEIHGSLLKSDTQEYLRLEEYQDIDKNVPEIATDYSEIPGRQDGGYVGTLEGEVTSLTNYRLDLQYQNTEVYVRLHNNLDVEAKVGDMVAITGFWERRNDIMRLNPWQKDHITVQAKESEPQEDADQESTENQESKESKENTNESEAEKSDQKPLLSINKLYELEHNQSLRVQGTVLIPEDQVYAHGLYITDGDYGVRVQTPQDEGLDWQKGDQLTITGSWHTSDTQEYVRLEDYQKKKKQDLELSYIPQDMMNSDMQGQFIQIQGEVISKRGQFIDLDTGSGEYVIRLTETLDPELRSGDMIDVSGLVERRNQEWRLQVWQEEQIHREPRDTLAGRGGAQPEDSQSEDQEDRESPSSEEGEEYQNLSSIAQVGTLDSDDQVGIQGTIITSLDTIYANSFYIFDGKRALRVQYSRNETPSLRKGDTVSITGSWHSSDTQEYLRLDQYQLQSFPQNEPQFTSVSTITSGDWGKPVVLRGRLVDNGTHFIDIDTGTDVVTIRFPSRNFEKPDMRKEDDIVVRGLVDVRSGEARLIPWQVTHMKVYEDVSEEIEKSEVPSESGEITKAAYQGGQAKESQYQVAYKSWDEYRLDLDTRTPMENIQRDLEPLSASLQETIPDPLRTNRLFLFLFSLNCFWWAYLLGDNVLYHTSE